MVSRLTFVLKAEDARPIGRATEQLGFAYIGCKL